MSAPCKIAVYAIARNEAQFCVRWAQAAAAADYRVVLDTGSDDNTVEQLEALGVTVIRSAWPDADGNIATWADKFQTDLVTFSVPFRFDKARNEALFQVPDDVDLCISVDMDEVLDADFIPKLRDLWEREGPFDKAKPWFNTGTWWRCDRVHSRHGWQWVSPVHEVTEWRGLTTWCPRVVDFEGTMWHWPDDSRPRDYTPLLELAVAEKPGDARMWTYLIRERYNHGDYAGTLNDATDQWPLLSSGWPPEAAASARLAAAACAQLDSEVHDGIRQRAWLEMGTAAGPSEPEARGALAKFHYDRQEWDLCRRAAERGSECPIFETHYLTDHPLRAWGLWDFAAVAAHQEGFTDLAVSYGYKAWLANPGDGRLLDNLRGFVAAQGIPTYAVIPKKAGERDDETAVIVEQLEVKA